MKNKVQFLHTVRNGQLGTRVKINGAELKVFNVHSHENPNEITTMTFEIPVDKWEVFVGRSWNQAAKKGKRK